MEGRVEEPGTVDTPRSESRGGVDRRTLIKRAAAAGAVAWTAPIIVESFASPAAAASGVVTFTARDSFSNTADQTAYLSPNSFTAANGATVLILVADCDGDAATTISSITGTSISSATQIIAVTYTAAKPFFSLRAWRASGTGSSGAITVTFAAKVKNIVASVIELAGNKTATPIAQSSQNSGSGTVASVTLGAAPAAGNGGLLAVSNSSIDTWTANTYTEIHDSSSNDGGNSVSLEDS